MILSGDFNVNFALHEAKPLIQSLESKLNLQINSGSQVTPTGLEQQLMLYSHGSL